MMPKPTSYLPAQFWRGGTSNALIFHRSVLPPSTPIPGTHSSSNHHHHDQQHHHPPPQEAWTPILQNAMGSPDPYYARQLNGMGGGISSLSKICVVSPRPRPRPRSSISWAPTTAADTCTFGSDSEMEVDADADVDFTFVQVGIKDSSLDMAGNCGNMSSAIGPFAVDEGLVDPKVEVVPGRAGLVDDGDHEDGNPENGKVKEKGIVTVKIFNTNTRKIIHSTFAVGRSERRGQAEAEKEKEKERWRYDPKGGYSIDGVPGTGSQITLNFLSPGGSKTGKVLPTGHPLDRLTITVPSRGIPDHDHKISFSSSSASSAAEVQKKPEGAEGSTIEIEASLVDVANPGVFVRGPDLGIPRTIAPADLDQDRRVMETLELIRRAGAVKMGLDPHVESVPKIVVLFPAAGPSSSSSSSPPQDPDQDRQQEKQQQNWIKCDDDNDDGRRNANANTNVIPEIKALAISMRNAHKAVPLTIALNIGVACYIEGSIAWELSGRPLAPCGQRENNNPGSVTGNVCGYDGGGDSTGTGTGTVVISHPSGKLEVGAKMGNTRSKSTEMGNGDLEVKSAVLMRTARLLMKGEVNCG